MWALPFEIVRGIILRRHYSVNVQRAIVSRERSVAPELTRVLAHLLDLVHEIVHLLLLRLLDYFFLVVLLLLPPKFFVVVLLLVVLLLAEVILMTLSMCLILNKKERAM